MTEQPRMTLQILKVLHVMLEAPTADWYGLELLERAGLKSGTIYPILARLERYGWLTSTWEDIDPSAEGRPRRRLYRLSAEGERAASAAIAESLGPMMQPKRRRPALGLEPRSHRA